MIIKYILIYINIKLIIKMNNFFFQKNFNLNVKVIKG